MQKIRPAVMLWVMMCSLPVIMQAQSQRSPVQAAWDAWAVNDRVSVEKYFKQAVEQNIEPYRARLGLAYLYQLMENQPAAWSHFEKAIALSDDPEPLIYAGMVSSRMLTQYNDPESGVLDLYKKMSEHAVHSTLRASASQMIGQYLEAHAQLRGAVKYFDRMNAVTDWLVIGPFDNISASGFNRTFPPETEMDSSAVYAGKNDIPVFWFPVHKIRNDRWIDFRRYFPQDESVFYANTFIYSPEKQSVQFRIGTSGAVKVFLNQEQILEWMDENNNDLDTYIAETELQTGWNRVLIKCSFSEINQCNFMLRITQTDGSFPQNIRVSSKNHPFQKNPGAPVKPVLHYAEAYFEDRIRQYPDQLENYLLLAEIYLRNDKAIEAELLLTKALVTAPDNGLLLHQIIEAYTRGEKYDEIITTLERLDKLDPMIPTVLDYKFDEAMDNQEYDKAAAIIEDIQKVLPEGPERIQYQIALFHAKNETEKIIAATAEAVKEYPESWDYVKANAYLSVYVTKSPDKAIKNLKKYAKNHTQSDVFTTLMDFFLKDGDFKNWEKTAIRRLEYSPAAPGFYYDMAQTYKTMQNFGQSEAYLRRTIALCPQSALYWTALADLQRATDRHGEAAESYKKALLYSPTFYDSRDRLRELQGKPPVFGQFSDAPVDSLIEHAPEAGDFPDDGAVILLNDAKRVVYPQGASESREEMLVRVFNPSGIDQFKEYWIGYNRYTEKLTVEKAVVIKPDGSEISADQNDNYIVFKTLEANDFIYLKWKIRNYYSGKLSNHFWDDFYFNGFYPIQNIHYSLLVPEDFQFQVKTQFMPETPPSIEKTADGTLYRWQLRNEPSIQYEYGMPVLNDLGKMLFITSIPDWAFLVDWYTDLAKTKTRSSHEIRKKVAELLGGETLPESEIIRRIHHFITEEIHYSYVPFRQSGLIPQKARDVLVNRMGDCKDMATLAIAMLRETGIDAHYVIVNTRNEGHNRNILPSINFNHAIVNIDTDNGPLYMDLTAQNYAVGTVPRDDVDAFALNIQPGTEAPTWLDGSNFLESRLYRETHAVLTEIGRLEMSMKTTRTGSFAAQTREAYRFLGQKDREQMLIQSLNRDYPNLELKSFVIEDIDSIKPDITYRYEFTVPAYLNEAGSYKILKMPWTDALSPNRALSYDSRKTTYNYRPPSDTEEEMISLQLPEGFVPVELPSKLEYSCAAAEYALRLSYKKGMIQGSRSLIHKKSEITPDEYAEFKNFYNNALKADGLQILLKTSR